MAQRNYILASYINNATEKPEVGLHVSDLSPVELRDNLSDMHSKGTSHSTAVKTVFLSQFLSIGDLSMLEALFAIEATMTGEEAARLPVSRLVDALLTAGAMMALRTPDIETLLPPTD